MGSERALVRRDRASLVVAESTDELYSKLIEEHGFVERSMFEAEPHGRVIPDGIYLERRAGGFAVWVPPDPERTVGNNPMLPPAVIVQALPHARGHQLLLRRKMPRTNKVALAGAGIGWLACATMFLASTSLGGPWFAFMFMPVIIMGLVIAHQARIAHDRSNTAWNALATALGPLAITGEVAEDPYRGDEARA